MLSGDNEIVFVNKILSGDRNAFIVLIKNYERLVLHIVTPLIGINEDREDICQEVFIKVYEKLNTFQFKSKLGTWIGNIAYNTSINFLQKKRNVLMSELSPDHDIHSFIEDMQSDGVNPEKIIIKKEDIKQLNLAIDELPKIQKSIVLLYYQEEVSLEEIGKILEIPVNTVKSHLFRARKSLKELLTVI